MIATVFGTRPAVKNPILNIRKVCFRKVQKKPSKARHQPLTSRQTALTEGTAESYGRGDCCGRRGIKNTPRKPKVPPTLGCGLGRHAML